MERLEQFEAMLTHVLEQYEATCIRMEALKKEGKIKSATYRQLMGHKLTYQSIISMYQYYGLIEK